MMLNFYSYSTPHGSPFGAPQILQQAPQGTTADTGSAVVLGRKVRKVCGASVPLHLAC